MASPNETKLPEQQSSNSNPTMPPSPAEAEFPSAEIAEDQTQGRDEEADPSPATDASGVGNDPCEHVQGKPNQISPDTAVTAISAVAVNPQQQAPTQATTVTPAHWITSTSDDLGADDEEGSEFDDEQDSDTDDGGIWDSVDLEPTTLAGEESVNNVSGYGEAPNSMIREGRVSIVDDMEEYVIDGPTIIDGVFIEDSTDEAPEGNVLDDEGMRSLETGQGEAQEGSAPLTSDTIVTKDPAESDHGNEESRGSVTATSAGPDDGNRDSSGSMTPASAGSDHDDEERGVDGQADRGKSEEGHIEGGQEEGTSSDFGQGEAIPADQDPSTSSSNQPAVEEGTKDADSVHIRIQYLVKDSKRSKASMCISVPTAITYPSFKVTILNALHHHEGFNNPRPIDGKAQISRLMVVLAKKESDASNFRRERELTAVNLQSTLTLMANRSIYDVVKVQFVPGTNGVSENR